MACTAVLDKVLIGRGISVQPMILPEVRKRVSALKPSFSVDLNDIMEINWYWFVNEACMMGVYVNFEQAFAE